MTRAPLLTCLVLLAAACTLRVPIAPPPLWPPETPGAPSAAAVAGAEGTAHVVWAPQDPDPPLPAFERDIPLDVCRPPAAPAANLLVLSGSDADYDVSVTYLAAPPSSGGPALQVQLGYRDPAGGPGGALATSGQVHALEVDGTRVAVVPNPSSSQRTDLTIVATCAP
jgi:hypothetical protein